MTTPGDRQDSNDEPGGRPTSSSSIESVEQGLSQALLEESTPLLAWCADCRARDSNICLKEAHVVVSIRDALHDEWREDWDEQGLRFLTIVNRNPLGEVVEVKKFLEKLLLKPILDCGVLLARLFGQTAPSEDHAAAPGSPAAAPAARSLDVKHINSRSTPEQKEHALQDVKGATQLYNLRCNVDLQWSLQMLTDFKATGEHLTLLHPDTAHLVEVCSMPLLIELHMLGDKRDQPKLPSGTNVLPKLKILKVLCYSQETTRSLLLAHANTLEKLQLFVGTETEGQWQWPDNAQLDSLLGGCGQWPNLKRLVLARNRKDMLIELEHNCDKCKAQRRMVKGVLPDTTKIQCGACESVRLRRAPPPQSEGAATPGD